MPIIRSLLDMDFYKPTMGQMVFHGYPQVPVRYAFRNRTAKVGLADIVREEDIRPELDHVRSLRFSKSELHYLRGTNEYQDRMFCEDYLMFLENLRLPEYRLERNENTYQLEFPGKWSEAIYWETIALSIMNELYYRALLASMCRSERDAVRATGTLRLAEKIARLKTRKDITFCDFGTRRRFSKDWQDYVVGVLAEELPGQFLGTSNTLLAMQHSLMPMGTSAHEMYMVMSGVMHASDDDIRASHNKVLQDWWTHYGWGLSIALTDTYGTDFFFRDMTEEQAKNWKGLRQDSGDPIAFGEKAIRFYEGYDIDPREKLLVFSDGLDIDTIFRIADHFRDRVRFTFGWGTNLTNDLGLGALSLVVKVAQANGHGTVKLSDNLAKAMGSPEDVERFKRIFGHTLTTSEECRY